MTSYKHVLMAVDIDAETDAVLARAKAVADSKDTKLTVLNVASRPLPAYGGYFGEGLYYSDDWVIDEGSIREKIQPDIAAMLDQAGLHADEIKVEFGRPVERILEVAESEQVDLILMGSHGARGVALLLGSTANGVLHRAKCDVLAVRV